MRIAFFGSPEAAVPILRRLLDAGHEVPLVVTQPDRPVGRGREVRPSPVARFALERSIAIIRPEKIRKDPTIPETLAAVRPEANVVAAYGQIIPVSVFALPPRGSLNVHFSLLPRYRGAAPVARAILNGETETGVTIMQLDERMDEGAILARERTAIRPDETAGELEARLSEMGAALLVETLRRVDEIRPEPQDPALATYAPKIAKEEGRIDWTRPADEIDRRVRAFQPWPTAYLDFRGRNLIIRRGRALGPEETRPGLPGGRAGTPGEIAEVRKDGIAVVCGDGRLYLITSLQPEGRREMPARAFCQGVTIAIGEKLG